MMPSHPAQHSPHALTRFRLLPAILVASLPLSHIAAQSHQNHLPAPVVAPAAELAAPPILENVSSAPHTVEVTITAAPTRLSLVPGTHSDAFAYNGRVPGPTLEVREGDKVIVHFRNNLPVPTTIHWHGVHIPVDADGSPFYPVPPGGTYDYVFPVQRGTAGTYWYHPHPDHASGYQIAKGLFGAIIIRAADDPLPASFTEKVLILADNRFSPDGAIDVHQMHSAEMMTSPMKNIDEVNGREGNILFVNGQVMPKLMIRSGEVQRWRIINASAARVYRLSLKGQAFLHVGDDGGLFEKPIETKEIVLANSERVEVLVRGTGAPGTQTVLQALPYDRYVPQTRPNDWNTTQDLLQVQYTNEKPVGPFAIPAKLRVIPVLDTAQATATRVMSMSQGFINGRAMDMARVDVSSKLGATEIWEIENLVGMDHPFHLHGFQFQLLDRNGVPVTYRSWKDTINVPKHETARFIVRYSDYPGKWMFHCHILDHEDMGMMGILEIQ
jgi:FtsP/CotA-like multicopper oxidase with cupredoxin domain